MIFKDLLPLALQNVKRRRKRAILTMLGVFIGIAAVVALVSLGQGLQQTINAQFEKIGADKILVEAKEVGFGGEDAPGQMTEHELELVSKVSGVKQTAGSLFRTTSVEFNNVQRPRFIYSIPDDAKKAELTRAFGLWEILDGRLLTHKDNEKAAVGYSIGYKNVFGDNVQVGNKIIIDGTPIKVVGILKRTGDPGLDNSIIVPEEFARDVLKDHVSYSWITVQSAPGIDPEIVADRVEKAIRRDRGQKEGKEDFKVTSSTELIASFNVVLNVIQVVFVGIAAISLFVGGIGIMNTMYTAVLERTNEIGVMKAIGAQNKDILGLFLIESGFLGLAGGLIGVILGIGISKGIEAAANASFGAGTLVAAMPPSLFIGALLFSFVVGTISGVLPARKASKLSPVDALRYE